jgi:hypothetical protein
MAIFGWFSLKEAEQYTRGAERKKLAERGMGLLVPIKAGTETVYSRGGDCLTSLILFEELASWRPVGGSQPLAQSGT